MPLNIPLSGTGGKGRAGSRSRTVGMWETVKQFSIFPQLSGVVIRHHPPDKAGQFSGNGGFRNIVSGSQSNTVKLSLKAFIGFVGIGHDLCWAASLPGFQRC